MKRRRSPSVDVSYDQPGNTDSECLDCETNKKTPFRVLSLFDGISCARVALGAAQREKHSSRPLDYLYSEICRDALAVTAARWPESRAVGDVTKLVWDENFFKTIDWMDGSLDLLVGGSPCTDLTVAGKRKGLDGAESKLFWDYVRLLNTAKPRYFLFENVATMKSEDKKRISEALQCEPIFFDAQYVAPIMRRRLFWTNIPLNVQELEKMRAAPRACCLGNLLVTPEELEESPFEGIWLHPSHIQFRGAFQKSVNGIITVGTRKSATGSERSEIFSWRGKMQGIRTEAVGMYVLIPAPQPFEALSCFKENELNSETDVDAKEDADAEADSKTDAKADSKADFKAQSVFVETSAPKKSTPFKLKGNERNAFLPRDVLETKKNSLDKAEAERPNWAPRAGERVRTLDIREVERLQGLQSNYTKVDVLGKPLSRYTRSRLIGLGFHVDVVAWIFKHLPGL